MIPVIYYHWSNVRGGLHHLEVSIKQAQKFNERVILLGDGSNSHIDVEHYNISDYYQNVKEFHNLYQHMSSNEHAFELKCLERWIVLANFVESQNFDTSVYLDSDVMTYCNYLERESLFDKDYAAMLCAPKRENAQVDPVLKWSVAGCVSYWKQNTILRFKDYLLRLYTDKIDQLKEKWKWHVDSGSWGGICDMTAMYLFYTENNNIGTLCNILSDNSTFDQCLVVSENYLEDEYKIDSGGKLIHWELNRNNDRLVDLNNTEHSIPYYHNLLRGDDSRMIRVNAMPEYARRF